MIPSLLRSFIVLAALLVLPCTARAQFTRQITPRMASMAAAFEAMLPKTPSPDVSVPPTLRAAFEDMERTFFDEWFDSWSSDPSRVTEPLHRTIAVWPKDSGAGRLQRTDLNAIMLMHCHPRDPDIGRPSPTHNDTGFLRPYPFIIDPQVWLHAICPSWVVLPQSPLLLDERLNMDLWVAAQFKPFIRAERSRLILAARRAADRFPSDPVFIGQRVRFLVDQRDSLAVDAALACKAGSWWCGMLSGYVAYSRGETVRADSLFQAAMAVAPDSMRCPLADLSVLLPPPDRAAYGKETCAQKQATDSVLWWLSDPLFIEPGNERRAEHYSRTVMVMLRSAVDRDERYTWAKKYGGDAVREMMVRYGVPTMTEWGGADNDVDHQQFLRTPYPVHFTTNEYSIDRLHTVPTWSAILHPLDASLTDWELNAEAVNSMRSTNDVWWPAEHFERTSGMITQLFDYQVAMFRRDSLPLLAAALILPDSIPGSATGRYLRGGIVLSRDPAHFRSAPIAGSLGATSRVQLPIAADRQLLGFEYVDDTPGTHAAARARFGITPPAPLSAMAAGAVGVSEIAILEASGDEGGRAPDPATALAHLFGTTDLKQVKKIDLYWETYGFAANDSVEFSVRVARVEPPNVLDRLRSSLRLGGVDTAGLSLKWQERRADNLAFTIPARVPTFGRVIRLDVSTFAPGVYTATVSVSRLGVTASSAVRRFTIDHTTR